MGKMVTEDTRVEVDRFEAMGRTGPYRDKACDDINIRAVKLDGDRPEERQMETIGGSWMSGLSATVPGGTV
jgi:hypothetical protein